MDLPDGAVPRSPPCRLQNSPVSTCRRSKQILSFFRLYVKEKNEDFLKFLLN